MSNSKKLIILLIILVLIIVAFVYVRHKLRRLESQPPAPTTPTRPTGSLNIAFGNPSNATADAGNKNNYLLTKPQYVLSYNNDKGEPNWVSWYLQSSDIGNVERQNNFHPEAALPDGFKRVTPNDYTGTGFDRGHVCNSKDRSNTEENNSETFSMANMLPQTPDLNRQVWESLESYCRSLVQRGGNQLYIIAGGYGSAKIIGRANKVNVPTNCWKVVAVLPAGTDVSRISKATRVIAVDMPNVQGIGQDSWTKYITTTRDLEQKTGYNFFSTLPKDVQDAIETKKDSGRP